MRFGLHSPPVAAYNILMNKYSKLIQHLLRNGYIVVETEVVNRRSRKRSICPRVLKPIAKTAFAG